MAKQLLKDTLIKNIKPGVKDTRLNDGNIGINGIKSPDIFSLIKPLFNKLERARRAHSEISAVFGFAIAHGFTDYDPAQAVAAQIPAQKVKHCAALTKPKDVEQLLRGISGYRGTFVVQCAFRLSPLLFQRPGEIRQMEWKDIDLEAKEWRYFVTKTEVEHVYIPYQLKSFQSWKKSSLFRISALCVSFK